MIFFFDLMSRKLDPVLHKLYLKTPYLWTNQIMDHLLFRYSKAKGRKPKNIVHSLANRQYWDGCHQRDNLRILKDLVLSDTVYYKKVFEKTSSKPILYEGDRLFMDNHRTCLTINGRRGQPAPLFKLPPCASKQKIEDVLVCVATLARIPYKNRGWRHCLVCVTANNYLLRYDLDTGEELERVYLHNKYQFRYMSMEDEAETIIIRSQHVTQESSNVYKAVCMFSIFPLEFICMFEVERKIFGKDIVDCMLYQGLMINKFSNGTLRFYDFNLIREKYTLPETLDCHPADKPLPLNLRITETPLVLFEIRCYQHDLHIGGSPWQYIQALGPKHFSAHLMDCDYQLTPGIRLGDEFAASAIDSDRAMFHPDDSGRIIHVTSQQITIYKLLVKSCGPILHRQFTISAHDPQLSPAHAQQERVTVTSSGRRSRKIKRENVIENNGSEVTLDGLDFEDELELATACHVTQTSTESYQGRLCFYDNDTGDLVKEMVLEEEWDELGEHLVVLDRDVIVHIVQSMNHKYTVHFYRLARHLQDGDHETGRQAKPKRKGRKKKDR